MENHQKNSAEDVQKMALDLYRQGAEAWKQGDKATAMTLYSRSAQLDPDGPGKAALEMARDIMAFFDPNQLNP